MNPFEKLWLYESWINELEERNKFDKSLAILTGGFYNPEMARKMMKEENPDYSLSDEEFEESWRIVQEKKISDEVENKEGSKRRRRRKNRRVVK